MKHLIISAFVALSFAACNTKETETKETTIETVTTPVAEPTPPPKTVIIHDQTPPATPPAPKPEKQNKVEISISDTGSGIKVRIP